jgi:L-lactate dehydrogenase complex protein LldE
VGIASLQVLERLGLEVVVPGGVACCGQPAANAGFEREGAGALRAFVDAFAGCERIVVPSGSCTLHVRAHAGGVEAGGAEVAARTVEICDFLHDEVGLEAVASLGASFPRRVAVHIGCHGLRGLGLARPTELQIHPFDKVRALLGTVEGLEIAELQRPDECCGFGGTFSVTEPAVSTKMGRDRLRDYRSGGAEAVVSTDASCVMHLSGLARRAGEALPMLHVTEVLAGMAGEAAGAAQLAGTVRA